MQGGLCTFVRARLWKGNFDLGLLLEQSLSFGSLEYIVSHVDIQVGKPHTSIGPLAGICSMASFMRRSAGLAFSRQEST